MLGIWNPSVLHSDVGVVLYGLGAEDPELFSTLAQWLE
jgi:hypothetical protein